MLNGQIKDAQNLRRVKECVQCKKNISCLYDSTESHRHGGRGGLAPQIEIRNIVNQWRFCQMLA